MMAWKCYTWQEIGFGMVYGGNEKTISVSYDVCWDGMLNAASVIIVVVFISTEQEELADNYL